MSTITKEQEQKIADWLETHELLIGIGTKEAACSIAAINLSLTGELTDNIPDCMSPVIGRWIIRTQDELPTNFRNGRQWKRLLPLAAGTGREHERERCALILDWMWTTVLPELQPIATTHGFGTEWADMLRKRDSASALVTKKSCQSRGKNCRRCLCRGCLSRCLYRCLYRWLCSCLHWQSRRRLGRCRRRCRGCRCRCFYRGL